MEWSKMVMERIKMGSTRKNKGRLVNTRKNIGRLIRKSKQTNT
jgi:hypothetical protein